MLVMSIIQKAMSVLAQAAYVMRAYSTSQNPYKCFTNFCLGSEGLCWSRYKLKMAPLSTRMHNSTRTHLLQVLVSATQDDDDISISSSWLRSMRLNSTIQSAYECCTSFCDGDQRWWWSRVSKRPWDRVDSVLAPAGASIFNHAHKCLTSSSHGG